MITISLRTVRNAMVGALFVAAMVGMAALFVVTPHASLVMP